LRDAEERPEQESSAVVAVFVGSWMCVSRKLLVSRSAEHARSSPYGY